MGWRAPVRDALTAVKLASRPPTPLPPTFSTPTHAPCANAPQRRRPRPGRAACCARGCSCPRVLRSCCSRASASTRSSGGSRWRSRRRWRAWCWRSRRCWGARPSSGGTGRDGSWGLSTCRYVLPPPALCAIAVLTGWQAGWALRWINVFFTPAFVLLPLSPSIGAVEVLKIIAVFGTSSPLPPVCLCWGSMAVSDAETQSSASSS